jgi:hypothetical protein
MSPTRAGGTSTCRINVTATAIANVAATPHPTRTSNSPPESSFSTFTTDLPSLGLRCQQRVLQWGSAADPCIMLHRNINVQSFPNRVRVEKYLQWLRARK